MFTTNPLPPGGQMFSDMRRHSQLVLRWNEQVDSTYPLSHTDGRFAPSNQRSGNGARQRSKSVASREEQGSREVPGPFVPYRVPSVPSRLMSTWKVQVRTRVRGSLAQKECRADFLEVAMQLEDPSEWRLARKTL